MIFEVSNSPVYNIKSLSFLTVRFLQCIGTRQGAIGKFAFTRPSSVTDAGPRYSLITADETHEMLILIIVKICLTSVLLQ